MSKPTPAENRHFDRLGAYLYDNWVPCPIYPNLEYDADHEGFERRHDTTHAQLVRRQSAVRHSRPLDNGRHAPKARRVV